MAAARKRRWLWLALAATLGASVWMALHDPSPDQALVVPRTRTATAVPALRQAEAAASLPSLALDAPRRAQITRQPQPLFSSQAVEAERLAAASQAAVAEMPALPFSYAGKLLDGGRYTVFLLAGERSLAVHAGDVLEQTWKVKAIRPPGMTLVYLPLKRQTVMDIGSAMNLGESN